MVSGGVSVEVCWRCLGCNFVSKRRRVKCPDCLDHGWMVKQTMTWGWATSSVGHSAPRQSLGGPRCSQLG